MNPEYSKNHSNNFRIENPRPFNPDIATIMQTDFLNPSEEDKEKITAIISDCLNKRFGKFPGVSDSIEKLKNRITADRPSKPSVVGNMVSEEFDGYGTPGFYNSVYHHVFLDRMDPWKNNESIFQIWLHESTHFMSQENGAGFRQVGSPADCFTVPEKYMDDECLYLMSEGIRVLCEGATQLTTEQNEKDMGFEDYEITRAYRFEVPLASKIYDALGQDKFDEIYSTMSLEEMRFKFEEIGRKNHPELNEGYVTGAFSEFLMAVGEYSFEYRPRFEANNFNFDKEITNREQQIVNSLKEYLKTGENKFVN